MDFTTTSTLRSIFQTPHLAIIMDGSGRWAQHRGQPRAAGHLAGVQAVRRTVQGALDLGIGVLTLYAFSADNWKRPEVETSRLMDLFLHFLQAETSACVDHGIRVKVFGRRDRLGASLREAIEDVENITASCRNLCLRLAFDYSARDTIARAVRVLSADASFDCGSDYGSVRRAVREASHDTIVPPVDLLIRTGGEQRLSDLFGPECAHAEILFTKTMWPDFGKTDLGESLAEFRRRERRFGALPSPAPSVLRLE